MPARQISPDTRHTFTNRGYLVLPGLVAKTTLDALRDETDRLLWRLLGQIVATRTPDPRITWWRLTSGHPYVLKIKPVLDLAPAAADVAYGPDVTGLAADLLGGPVRLMEDKLMIKEKVQVAAGWAALPVLGEEVCKHTDAAYFQARGYDTVVTVALCLDDCTAEAGALRVWPTTHRQNVEQVPTPDRGPVVPDHAARDSDAVLLEAPAGSVLAWDARLVHASGPNHSGRPRRLLVLGYTPAASEAA
jgi:hypothetical protein